MIVPFDRLPVLTTNGVWEIMWCVSSSTEYPEESVKAIDLIYSDEELTDLLLYGVEQKDYVAPVSYTHLDVYKRQLLYGCLKKMVFVQNWICICLKKYVYS